MALHKQEQFRSLSECCKALYQATGREVARELALGVVLDGFDKLLEKEGFRSFAPVACGSSGAVFKTTAGQVLRLRYVLDKSDTVPPEEIHEQLQTVKHGTWDSYFYEIMPQIETDVTQKEADAFERHLKAKGYSVEDFTYYSGDIGKLPDGTLVGVDKDAINADEKKFTAADKNWLIESDQESIFPYLHGTGYISKQEHFYPALRDKRVRGVLSDSDLQRLQQGELEALRLEKPECFDAVTAENLGQFVELVKGGLYPSQAQEMLHTSARGVPANPPQRGRA
ncbi:MAG: hypothetical protein K2Q12_08155 [Rickettsiales bacterium]|nr:hypothetical protein [Rickettsiales bacterium]